MIVNTLSGQIDVSPFINSNINSAPMFRNGGNAGNATSGASLTTRNPGSFTGLATSAFNAFTGLFSVGARTIGDSVDRTYDRTLDSIDNAISEGNSTIRELGDNVQGTAKSATTAFVSYGVVAVVLAIATLAILYVPPKVLKGGA